MRHQLLFKCNVVVGCWVDVLLQMVLAISQLRSLTHQRHLTYLEKEHVEKEEIPKVILTIQRLAR